MFFELPDNYYQFLNKPQYIVIITIVPLFEKKNLKIIFILFICLWFWMNAYCACYKIYNTNWFYFSLKQIENVTSLLLVIIKFLTRQNMNWQHLFSKWDNSEEIINEVFSCKDVPNWQEPASRYQSYVIMYSLWHGILLPVSRMFK